MKSSKSVSLAEAQLDGGVNTPLRLSQSAMTELESKHNDGASTVMDDEVVGKEELQMIKARTMFQMTEELHGVGNSGRKRLLFLTNSQAELIASSEASMQKMLDALEIPRPKLVINLIASAGHSDYATKALGAEIRRRPDAGILRDKGSFASAEEERKALAKLDHFMASVILPLAAQTNAIIFCNACAADCMLAASLTRMLAVHRSTWGKEPPFTVVSATCALVKMYRNPDMTSTWRSVRRASRAWRQRDTAILEATWAYYNNDVPTSMVDLDPNAMIYLIVDSIGKRGNIRDRGAFLKLRNELLRYLATSLPSLTIKTGHSDKPTLDRASQHASSLSVTQRVQAARPFCGRALGAATRPRARLRLWAARAAACVPCMHELPTLLFMLMFCIGGRSRWRRCSLAARSSSSTCAIGRCSARCPTAPRCSRALRRSMSSTATPCSSRRWPSVLMPAASPTFTRYADLVYGLARPAIIPTLHAVAGTLWRWRRDHLGA